MSMAKNARLLDPFLVLHFVILMVADSAADTFLYRVAMKRFGPSDINNNNADDMGRMLAGAGVGGCSWGGAVRGRLRSVWRRRYIRRLKAECGGAVFGDMFLAKCYARYTTSAQIYARSNHESSESHSGSEKTFGIIVGLVAAIALLIIFLTFRPIVY